MKRFDQLMDWTGRLCLYALTAWYWYYLTRLLLVSDPWALMGGYSFTGHAGPDTSATLPSLGIHFACYFIGSALLLLSLSDKSRSAQVMAIGLILAHAAGGEWLQQWVPHRFPATLDLIADALGLCLAWLSQKQLERLLVADQPSVLPDQSVAMGWADDCPPLTHRHPPPEQ